MDSALHPTAPRGNRGKRSKMNNAEKISKLEQDRQEIIAKIRGDENAMHWV